MDIFCRIINDEIPSKVVFEDEIVKVIMDVNPRSNGHLLIIPKTHYQDLFDIDMDVLSHIMKTSKKVGELLVERLNCKGITLEENNGIALGNTEKKYIYLTFDEGYEAGYTTKILETLQNNNVKAAFFITAHYVNTQEEIVRQMVNEGHIIGNQLPPSQMYQILKNDKRQINSRFA